MAITQYYVDPAIAGNSGTGTIGDPYGDLQYALNTITRNATDGDQINIKAGTAEMLAAAISYTIYGSPTAAAPLIFRGYNSEAGDGGIGVINGSGSYAVSASKDYVHYIDLRLTNCGAQIIVRIGNHGSIVNCEVDTTSSIGIYIDGAGRVAGCYVHDCTSHGIYTTAVSSVSGCFVAACGGNANNYQIAAEANLGLVWNNICAPPVVASGIYLNGYGVSVIGNSVYGTNGTGRGINVAAVANPALLNNIVEGFSGGGGVGILFASGAVLSMYHSNAVYNNTTNVSGTPKFVGLSANNDVLSGSPFVNAASGDYDINGTVAGVTEDAWPLTFPGIASTAPKADKGAVQAGSGGGGAVSISPWRGNF